MPPKKRSLALDPLSIESTEELFQK